ncbi:hypothetical protein IJG27_02965 [Candidatus Saccharibacteria bacterium]|nr:hypothetical protein [Candidatus Saccharibacteria bacterium]
MNKKIKIALIILSAIVLLSLAFYLVSQNIIVEDCGISCECRYSQNEMCNLMGCSRITLWDEIICKITHLFQ